MKRLRKLSKVELYEDIIINILHRLPSKSLVRFTCVSKSWRKYIGDSSLCYSCRSQRWRAQPNLIGFFYRPMRSQNHRFFFTLKESSSLVNNIDGTSLDESLNFLGKRAYIVASSNGFLLCNKYRKGHRFYYVYNPACTRQSLALPKTKLCINVPAVGFSCKVDDPVKDVVSFTIVRYDPASRHWDDSQYNVTIETFSSVTNMWTVNKVNLDIPLILNPFINVKSSSVGVLDGVFCWLDSPGKITVYDSVYKCFWALQSPEHRVPGHRCFVGLSGGAFYFAANNAGEVITVWKLESNIRSRDAVWVRKYDAHIVDTVLQCPEAADTPRVEDYAFAGFHRIEVLNMNIHPTFPNIFYLDVRGKVISYDMETDTAQLIHDFGQPWRKTEDYYLFAYEWNQWPRLL